MNNQFNIYCDESCHLENDRQKSMVLGAIWCPLEKRKEIAVRLKEIKIKHGLSEKFEVKWTKISYSKVNFYLDYVDYFFDDDDLYFRALVVPDKSILNHDVFNQDHDTWYYKMYFNMIKGIISPTSYYNIYIDIKDTHGGSKARKLHDVLGNNFYDFNKKIIKKIQIVGSFEIEQLQLADLFIGAVSYVNRYLLTPERDGMNQGKLRIINRIRDRSGYSLNQTTLSRELKMNMLIWQPREQYYEL